MNQAQGILVTVSGSQKRPFPCGKEKIAQVNVSQDAAGAQVPDMLCNHHGRQKRGQASQRFNFGGGTWPKPARLEIFLRTVQPLCKGADSKNQHQHQRAKQQSASSTHSSRGPCLIFLGPQHQILLHRHRGHVGGPLSKCPAYWSPEPRCRCGKHTSRLRTSPHGTATPKAVGDAAKDLDGASTPWIPLRLGCDSMTYLFCLHHARGFFFFFLSCLRVGSQTSCTLSALYLSAVQCSGWGLFLDLGAPLANLTGTLPRLGNLRAPDGLLTWPDLTCSTLPPLPFAPATLHFTM